MRRHCRTLGVLLALSVAGAGLQAQIRVNPTGVSTNAMGPTTVFLTFGGLAGQTPVDAFWCGRLVPASPDRGQKCDPSSLYGRLPARYDLARLSGTGGFTDIMSIPRSVTRRAYQAATSGGSGTFFYVRRFASVTGGADEYVAVTCRLTGGGAHVPFSLTDVAVEFDPAVTVLFVPPGQTPPPVSARIAYTGTGRLVGRWEIVLPGEELPTSRDLLAQAALPAEERGTQRRYTQLERFNVFLPPGGRVTMPGPDPARLPNAVEGSYLLLLRVEAADDREGDSDLAAAGAGSGVVHSGAVAGFPMPTLRYVVGAGESGLAVSQSARGVRLLLPRAGARLVADSGLTVSWIDEWRAATYRVDFESATGTPVFSAFVRQGVERYRAPSFVVDPAMGGSLTWRVTALDAGGGVLERSAWRKVALGRLPDAGTRAPANNPEE